VSADVAPPGDAAVRRRVLDHLGWTVQVLSGSVLRYRSAWGVRTPALPQVWSLNQLHVSGALTVEEVLALCQEHQSDMPFRHVEISDDATAAGFEACARAEGWTIDSEVLMALGPWRGSSDTTGIVVLDED
jgi:hypothetical protein